MKIGKAVLVVALPVIAGYAAAKSYVHYQTRAAVERVVEQAAILGDLTYGGISSTLSSGTVQVEKLVFSTRGVSDTITIRALSLSAGSFMALLDLARQSDSNKPPEALAVRFDDLRLAADGPLLQFADGLTQAAAAASGVPQTSPHCGNQAMNGLAIITRLGYDSLIIDGEINYRVDAGAGSVTVNTGFEIQDMARFRMRMVFAGSAGLPDFTGSPTFKELDVTYKDLSYKDRVKSFCTKAAKISDAEYLQAELEHGTMQQQFGIVPGPGLREAYRTFLETPNAELSVHLQPTEGFDPRGVSFYRPEDVLQQLNARVSVNSKPVEDLSFEYGAPAAPKLRRPAEAADAPAKMKRAGIPPRRTSQERLRQPQGYRAIQVGELERYVDYYVRLHEVGQEPREGVLTQVSGGVALVERRYGTGKITVKVPLVRVARAEVLR